MGTCCMKNRKIIHKSNDENIEKAPVSSSISYSAQVTFKKIPTNIKIIPASPPRNSVERDIPSPKSMKSSNSSSPISNRKQQNLFEMAKIKLNSSQTLKPESTIDEEPIHKAKRFSLMNLQIPGPNPNDSNDSESDRISSGSEFDSIPNQKPHHGHSQTEVEKTLALPFLSSKSMHEVIRTNSMKKERSLEGKKILNQYTFEGLLGTGAFGKVYKAVDENGDLVAVKIYNKRILRSRWIGKKRTAWDLVESEILIMGTLDHPNIIKLIEVIDKPDSKKIYLVLEYAEKGSIFDMCPIIEKDAKKYFKDFVNALEYLHNESFVVHRDIKPQNMLVCKDNILKICDFGAAQFIDNMRDELTNSAGTYLFMPPEAHKTGGFRGKPADIWASGITLFYILTGKTPYKSRNISKLCEEINDEDIVFPEQISENAKDLIKSMTNKDPEKRCDISMVKLHQWFKDM
ncbi:hypothetical protein SteCoe_25412 [Stentor coeruleus]|uniref:Protein kinase domain-containing protein n=1 Tax=Stentor coeruleus TaxID=5963 RepID=A0A1R2BFM8_9CILI|nr:hypothetical protein SteCoe_25412 [Stentor coeruleus]